MQCRKTNQGHSITESEFSFNVTTRNYQIIFADVTFATLNIELSARQQIAVHLTEKHVVAKLHSSERHSESPGLSQKILTQTKHIIKYHRHAIIPTFSTLIQAPQLFYLK